MGLQGYVGNAEDVRRIRRQEKQREDQKKKFEELKKLSEQNVDKAGLRQFDAGTSEVLETAFKNETIGLQTREEFVEKRNTIKERFEEESRRRKREEEEAARKEKEKRKKLKEKQAKKAKLSFAVDEDVEGEEVDADGQSSGKEELNGDGQPENMQERKFGKFGKDPTVQTEFLPDKDRELAEVQLKEQLKREWQLRQQLIKNEPLEITYSYWNGTGHRRQVSIRKGDSVGQFLTAVREQLAKDFREMRSLSISNLMYVKEDIILPHNVTFYDLIVNKVRGKSGPLFHFDVHDDIRLRNDARIEKNESHAGKVVERHWYDKNKHIFPASRWEVFDAESVYDKYTIH